MSQVTRKNHFLPRWYLRRWSEDGRTVRMYRLLVPHRDFPVWADQPISRAASRRDLYTGFEDGQEVDRFEEWLTVNFEEPAVEAVARAVEGQELRKVDLDRLAFFFAIQDLRTPLAFVDFLKRWGPTLEGLVDNVVRESLERLTRALEKGEELPKSKPPPQDFSQPLSVTKVPSEEPGGGAFIKAEVVLGRGLWLNSMQSLLTGVANHLRDHRWSIVEPFGSSEWFTSDHPSLRLNYYEEGRYDFKGGWGNDGTELLLPLSPRHLLYTKVGAEAPQRFTMPRRETFLIQKLLAERAHREVIARRDERRVGWFRERHVDLEMYEAEAREWDNFHGEQRKAELGEGDPGST